MELQRSVGAHLHPEGLHGINTYLALSLNHAKAFNKTSCWVCTKIPHSVVSGIPLLAIPFDLSECCGYWVKWKTWSERDNNTNNHNKDWETGWRDHIVTGWDGNCLQQRDFSDWFWPSFNLSKIPPNFVVEQAKEKPNQCLVQEAWEERMLGKTECRNYVCKNHTMGPQVALNDTYFVCGNRAYPWLPDKWTGSCYLSFIVLHMCLINMSPFEHLKRGKRSFTSTELFFMILVPHYGVGQTSIGLAELATSLESLANKTAFGMVGINSEVVAMHAVAMQNRVALLDLVLAAQGGTCAVIGSECCTYIPDNSEQIGLSSMMCAGKVPARKKWAHSCSEMYFHLPQPLTFFLLMYALFAQCIGIIINSLCSITIQLFVLKSISSHCLKPSIFTGTCNLMLYHPLSPTLFLSVFTSTLPS
uniref:Uncharacterized protein n=1 Tax=Eptatretus burgeri TaxID=7764 RepID=A0A8C4Q0G9_EPTBU